MVTREEAIKMLQVEIACMREFCMDEPEISEAYDMAIAALREQGKVVEIDHVATNLQPEASNQQVTESLQRNGFGDSEEPAASKNQVKGIRLISRPWQPQDLLDDLQMLIDEEPDNYLNGRRTTLCMARAYLKDFFADTDCTGCRWWGVRPQRCSCCRRNTNMKDNYEV